jgi:FMN phosphatase YigB (HAD superfamily)
MKISIFLLSFITIVQLTAMEGPGTPPITVLKEITANSAVVFATDFHDVVVHTNKMDVLCNTLDLLKQIHKDQGLLKTLEIAVMVALHILYETLLRRKEETVSFVSWTQERYPWIEQYAQRALALRNNYTPQEGTLAAIRELKKNGVIIALATNLHEDYASSLEERYADLMQEFDIRFYANAQHGTKPQKKYFEQLIEQVEKEKKIDRAHTRFIFTDDSKKNIKGAYSVLKADNTPLIEAILFENAQQLTQELYKKGVLTKQKQD